MSSRDCFIDKKIVSYLSDNIYIENRNLRFLRKIIARFQYPQIQISYLQAHFISTLLKMARPKKILELGTYIGYSALVFALETDDDCIIHTCDRDDRYIKIAKHFWKKANVLQKVKFIHAEAHHYLDQLTSSKEIFDLIFIDADKRNYLAYYEKAINILNYGGVIVFDNTLLGGKVCGDVTDKRADAMRNFNKRIRDDSRVSSNLLPLGDGMTICVKL